MLAFFSPSPLVSIGQRGSGLPLAPWALLLCWWSPYHEPHSKRILILGEAGVGTKIPSGRWPEQSTRRQLGSSAPRPHLTHGSKLYSGRCILEMYTLLVEQNTAPMRLCSAKQRLPFSTHSHLVSIGQRGSGLPLAPSALLLCWWSPEL